MAVSSVGWRSIDDDAAVDAATRALFAFNKKRKKNVPGSQTGSAREGGGDDAPMEATREPPARGAPSDAAPEADVAAAPMR